MKNDERDATDLVDLLRMGRLAEAWVAPPAWRELRELVRYRAKLVHLRTGLKAQVHAVLAKEGVAVPMADLFGTAGSALLDTCRLGEAYTVRVESLRDILEVVDGEIAMLAGRIEACLVDDAGYWAIQALPGVGPVLAAVFVAEIGDIARFPSARHQCSWAGLTPTHRESDTTVRRGHITKMACGRRRLASASTFEPGGDRDHSGWPRYPSSTADLRLCGPRDRR
ncbi:MAG TPA: transposase, partial [Acidimicrobiales bacterium]|nr:transposase [Acidimicrobiales bacterium]